MENQGRIEQRSSKTFELLTQSWARLFGIALAHGWFMFDIFTSNADGTSELIISVSSLSQAQETAFRLSLLAPDEHFGYFEKLDDFELVMTASSWEQTLRLN